MSPSIDPHAARLAKFERERLIVEYLNRGVSVPEIATHVCVSEKRMRAIIREIMARRMPAPPEEFVATQVSRLSEALLVAYSAMSGLNLKAVDRVVKIVREFDRCHGFVAAERRLPDASPRITVGGLEAPAQNALTLGAALFCRAEFAPRDPEEIEFASGLGAASPGLRENAADVSPPDEGKQALVPALSSEREREREPAPRVESRPEPPGLGAPEYRRENPPQDPEKLESAPGWVCRRKPRTPETRRRSAATLSPPAAPRRQLKDRQSRSHSATPSDRPENPLQHLEKLESRPGNGLNSEASPALGGTPFIGSSWPKLRATLNGVAAG